MTKKKSRCRSCEQTRGSAIHAKDSARLQGLYIFRQIFHGLHPHSTSEKLKVLCIPTTHCTDLLKPVTLVHVQEAGEDSDLVDHELVSAPRRFYAQREH